MAPHENCLGEMVLMMGHKICFHGEIWLIIPELSLLPFLIWSTGVWLLMRLNHAFRIANCVRPDQTAPSGSALFVQIYLSQYLELLW